MSAKRRLTRKQHGTESQEEKVTKAPNSGLKLNHVEPKTENQRTAFSLFESGQHLLLGGAAGSGKTFTALYLAIKSVMNGTSDKKMVHIVRSVVPTRDMGFLPGSQKEKAAVYEAPYQAICQELFSRGDAYGLLKSKNMINFMTTSFIRGITLNDCVVIVEECQNMDSAELQSVISRVGQNCIVIICGDYRQNDLFRKRETSGFSWLKNVVNHPRMSKHFGVVEFTYDDIVRSGFVKDLIIACDDISNDNEPLSISHKQTAKLEILAAE